jgi:hypothetical protein
MTFRPYYQFIQSSAADVTTKNVRGRFDALATDLAVIGASYHVAVQTHDDVHIKITCPPGREAEAQALLDKHFPP